jgi:hypothetical protein
MRRAGFLVFGDLERLPDGFADDVGIIELRVPLRDRSEHADDVERLVTLLVQALQSTLSCDCDERCFVQVRIRDARHEVRRTGTERPETDACVPREPAVDVRHERGSLLVADRDELDIRVPKRKEQIFGLFARNTEHVLDAFALETVHEQIRGFHSVGTSSSSLVSACWLQTVLRLTNSLIPASESSRP